MKKANLALPDSWDEGRLDAELKAIVGRVSIYITAATHPARRMGDAETSAETVRRIATIENIRRWLVEPSKLLATPSERIDRYFRSQLMRLLSADRLASSRENNFLRPEAG